jgi:DNA-binding SARP family transcriptional activator
MEFRLLGPLEAREGDRPIALGGSKPRAVLAVLLLNANEVVSRDRLIDELWGERPPETAVTSLQVYVSRLRKVLPPETLVTQAPGYVLRVDPEHIDVRRFERLVEERRHREALALWRGPPLAEFGREPFAQAEIARLEDLRLAAVEERIEADLAEGRHAELVGELERMIALHPLRERLRGQLMLALYRSGRQAEALEAYQAARGTLVDELGLDPGAALQRLEKSILVHDPALDLPSAPAPPDAGPIRAPEPGERKLVTVLFADLGVTTADDPERARSLLDRVHEAAAAELELAGGIVERGVADSILATFGAPAAQEDHAHRALHAALALRARLVERFGAELAPRMGVESGTVVFGGADGPLVAGRPVTAAAALAREAAVGEVRVGARAASVVGGAFELVERNRSSLLVGAVEKAPARRTRALGRTFVGRSRELEQLEAALAQVERERTPTLVTILGEAGVGKTTLVRRLRAAAADRAQWHAGRCLAYGRAITYRPLADVLRERLELHENEPEETIRRRLQGREILGLTLGLDTAGDLHPREARDRLHDAWVELVSEAAADAPLALVVEDVHWAEEALLALLERMAREVRAPLLVLATARPELLERAAAFGARGRATRVWLEALSEQESGRMLDELAANLPPSVRETLVDRAEGNPFFVEELLQTLIDRGALRREDGSWTLAEGAEPLAVPDTIHAVLAARVDLLPPLEKRALQAAAVVGRVFWERPVHELVGEPELDFLALEERDLVRHRSATSLAGEREYLFKHALLRDVAYGSLPADRRARLHAAFAEWLESEFGERDEHASLLAHHYAEAVRPEDEDLAWADQPERLVEFRTRAVERLRRAAGLAVARFELDEALALVEQALELAEAPAQVELLRLAGDAHRMRFEMSAFREALERALANDPPRETAAEIYSELAGRGVAPYMWKEAPSSEDVERWTRQTLDLAEPGSRARARALAAKAQLEPRAGRDAADEALLIAERLDDSELLVWACYAQRRIASIARDYVALGRWTDRTIEVLHRLRDPSERANEQFVAGIDYLKLGRLADAGAVAREHGATALELSAHHRVHVVSLFVFDEIVRGRWAAAFERGSEASEAAVGNLDTPCQFNWRSLAMCALAAAQHGDERAARRLEERAREIAAGGAPEAHEPAFIRLALHRGELDLVERLLHDAPLDGSFFDVDTPAARLDALVALGDRRRVEAEAAGWLEVPGYTQPFALRALGLASGDPELVERSAVGFEALGLDFRAAETRTAL